MNTTRMLPGFATGRRPGAVVRALSSAVCLLAAVAAHAAVPTCDFGPIYSSDTDLHGARRTRALGPFFERIERDSGDALLAIRPFYCRVHGEKSDRTLRDFAWPVAMVRTMGADTFWRFLTLYGNDFDNSRADSRMRCVAFPVLFWGRDADGNGYFALFPLGGTIREYLTMDKVTFVLFPLFSHAEQSGISSYSVLWPLINVARGEDTSRMRFLPFYAKATREGKWEKTYVMWPFWNSVRYLHRDEKEGAGGFILFPLCGHIETKDESTFMLLPPFFRWTRGTKGDRLLCPWPFVQYAAGDREKLYLWPLWGRRTAFGRENVFFLWPFGSAEHFTRDDRLIRRFRVLPFLYLERSDRQQQSENPTQTNGRPSGPEAPASVYVKLWPLCSYRREGDAARFRTLELWPPKDTPPIERNLAPLWTLFKHERVGTASESELLWGLFRRRLDADGGRELSVFPLIKTQRGGGTGLPDRSWSVLGGLLGYERKGPSRSCRFLYFIHLGGERDNA